MIPMQTMVTAAVSPETRGSFMSIKSSFQQLASSVGTLVAGAMIIDQQGNSIGNYQWVGVFAVGMSLCSLLIIPQIQVAAGNRTAE